MDWRKSLAGASGWFERCGAPKVFTGGKVVAASETVLCAERPPIRAILPCGILPVNGRHTTLLTNPFAWRPFGPVEGGLMKRTLLTVLGIAAVGICAVALWLWNAPSQRRIADAQAQV